VTFEDIKGLAGCYFRVWGALLTGNRTRYNQTMKRAEKIHDGQDQPGEAGEHGGHSVDVLQQPVAVHRVEPGGEPGEDRRVGFDPKLRWWRK
jgi:hypothetical protein